LTVRFARFTLDTVLAPLSASLATDTTGGTTRP
jgi:hypothetical protein